MKPLVSVVIASYKDDEHVKNLLKDIKLQKDVFFEVIVVKAEERFETYKKENVSYLSSSKGRALQMNQGAKKAKAPYLLFLHADSRLSCPYQLKKAYDTFVQSSAKYKAGHFYLNFHTSKIKKGLVSFFYYYLEKKTHLNFPSTVHGDQGLWIEKEFFENLEFFDESFEFLEDVLLAQKMESLKGFSWILFRDPLITSARRFERLGEFKTYVLMQLLVLALCLKKYDFLSSVFYSDLQASTFKIKPVLSHFNILFLKPHNIYSLGRVLSSHVWQVFFVFDVIFFKTLCPLSKTYRIYFSWLFINPIGYSFLGFLGALFYLALLPVFFFIKEEVFKV